MQKLSCYLVTAAAICAISTPLVFSQGRGGGAAWNTAGADAERSSWLPGDDRISPSAMPGFQFLWKVKTSNDTKQSYSLSSAVMVDRYIGYRGFRSYAFFGGASNNAIALDSDLGRVEWTQNLGPASSAGTAACPGAMSAGVTRAAQFTPAVQAGGGAGRAGGGRGGGAQSGVGEAGAGAVTIGAPRPARGGGAAFGAPGASGGGRGGRGAVGASGRAGGGGGGRAPEAVYAVSTDGMLHTLYISNGENAKPPVRFLPANANASGLLLVDGALYASTSGNCGSVPNGIWMMETANNTPMHWFTNGGGVAGTVGPAVGSDGTVFAATMDGDYSPAAFSDSVVALDGKTLALKGWFTPGKSAFTSSPVVFSHGEGDKEEELVAVANKDGKLYLLDGANLGSADHKTPLASAQIANASSDAGALASWADSSGTRWILVPADNGIVALKVVDQGGKPTLQSGWVSPNIASPLAPIVINGVVFTASGSGPAVLHALDGETGKDLFNSGATITAPVPHSGGLSGTAGQIYLGTSDNMIYAFGVPLVSPALAAKQPSN